MARYEVYFMRFVDGVWYPQTKTDSRSAAFSVAKIGKYGRACRLIDTVTGEILYETAEDPDMKAVNGNVDKLKW